MKWLLFSPGGRLVLQFFMFWGIFFTMFMAHAVMNNKECEDGIVKDGIEMSFGGAILAMMLFIL